MNAATDIGQAAEENDVTNTDTRTLRRCIAALCLTLAGPVMASRPAYQQTGEITGIAAGSHTIQIDGVPYQLADKVAVNAATQTTETPDVNSLESGARIGYALSPAGENQAPQITNIWVLPGK